ncbi:serine hydrolase domain-containing protein [Anatilimnocola floriformis]|uniref:serine hydrolase domain-containing protein n=1 Tax=Anatilimnocola floriformis TaxID=2948575 RepID=UPI0020C310C2|nr:serine hydrolase domain-containing protein [Anatilimnocola floriformis]
MYTNWSSFFFMGWCLALFASVSSAAETAEILETIRSKHDLPALATIVIKDGKVCDQAAVGVRKSGDKTPVTTADKFHIGSCTKSMTATLAGIYIDQGKLRWDTTIGETFPDLKAKMQPEYAAVTVEQLLQNRGGVPTEPPAAAWSRAWQEKGSVAAQRREFITAVLAEKPAASPGSKMIYSNQGYTIVGAMLEKVGGKPWEDLIAEQLFKPLKMKSAGFGPPGVIGKVQQPWGHTLAKNEKKPSQGDNPPAIGPAGRVHCSLPDFASYVQLHLQSKEVPQLLKPETLQRLHTPAPGGDYACGWVVVDRPWAGGKALNHNGSNTMWYAVMWLAPNKQFGVISAANIGGEAATKGCDDVAAAMIKKWLP